MVTRYDEARRDGFGVEQICRELGVPVSTYYTRRARLPPGISTAPRYSECIEQLPQGWICTCDRD